MTDREIRIAIISTIQYIRDQHTDDVEETQLITAMIAAISAVLLEQKPEDLCLNILENWPAAQEMAEQLSPATETSQPVH